MGANLIGDSLARLEYPRSEFLRQLGGLGHDPIEHDGGSLIRCHAVEFFGGDKIPSLSHSVTVDASRPGKRRSSAQIEDSQFALSRSVGPSLSLIPISLVQPPYSQLAETRRTGQHSTEIVPNTTSRNDTRRHCLDTPEEPFKVAARVRIPLGMPA